MSNKVSSCKLCQISFEHFINVKRVYCSHKCSSKAIGIFGKMKLIRSDEDKVQSLKKRFEKFVVKTDNCWEWNGSIRGGGYGQIGIAGGSSLTASRASWIIHFGKIPEGMWVLHQCDNRKCTNPKHLFLGTCKDNIHDMIKKGRKITIPKGTLPWNTQINHEIASEIRKMTLNKVKHSDICKKYNVSLNIVRDISRGKTWKSV